jgi:hypothetical protein
MTNKQYLGLVVVVLMLSGVWYAVLNSMSQLHETIEILVR